MGMWLIPVLVAALGQAPAHRPRTLSIGSPRHAMPIGTRRLPSSKSWALTPCRPCARQQLAGSRVADPGGEFAREDPGARDDPGDDGPA